MDIQLAGWRVTLLPDKALYLPDVATLLVADVHLGKGHSFRRLGVPVPAGSTRATLDALTGVLQRTSAQRLVILGDFLHGPAAQDATVGADLAAWRAQHAGLPITLVLGNHDQRAGQPDAGLSIEGVEPGDPRARIGPFALCHHPDAQSGAYALAGHVHPCVHLPARVGRGLRLPCFWFGAQVGVLPAFGHFTGMHAIEPEPGARVYPVARGTVYRLP